MSRCFPFPPPGFARSEVLIESIKLQNEKETAKKKKEQKREKKEKKDKTSKHATVQSEDRKHGHKKRHRDEGSQLDQKHSCHQKIKEDESDQLEKSGLTEDQGSAYTPYNCDSPDSAQNSSKRLKQDTTESSKSSHGSGLRIRFQLSKPKEHQSLPAKVQVSQSLLKPERSQVLLVKPTESRPTLKPKESSPPQVKFEEPRHPVLPVLRPKEPELSGPCEPPCFSGRTDTIAAQQQAGTSIKEARLFEGYRGSSKSRKKEARFNDLIVDWSPQPLHMEMLEIDEQDWLLGAARKHQEHDTTSCVGGRETVDHAGALCSWPPRACHLAEADMYALPYVVPF